MPPQLAWQAYGFTFRFKAADSKQLKVTLMTSRLAIILMAQAAHSIKAGICKYLETPMRFTLSALLFVFLLLTSRPALAYGGGGNTQSNGGSQQANNGSQQSANQNSPANPPAAPPAGITNGTLPIEAILLAYKVLDADTARMAESINHRIDQTKDFVVIGTSTDIASIVQLRAVIGQANIITERL